MSDVAIKLEGVRKTFRRFQHPVWRVLDALGWPVSKKRYDVFTALADINLDIHRGERVALIGRNGAGKSTLLRVVCGQMRPDEGEVKVRGEVQALMELGTGFHPDFTGTENIRSALAYQGMKGRRLASIIDEIVDFSELEAFMSRPVREYSSGMYARLAFAVATAISPEILIIDEILGTGDAYFVGKCIQRMKALTSNGCTILFVSHDLSSAQMLCDRGVWLDRGRILEDNELLSVSKAYLASVRADEEFRLRARSMHLSRSQLEAMDASQEQMSMQLLRLVGSAGPAPKSPLAVSEIRFGIGGSVLGTLSPKGCEGECRIIRDKGLMNWGGPKEVHGRVCWLFGDFGGRYGHAPWQIGFRSTAEGRAWVEVDYHSDFSAPVAIERYEEKEETYIRMIELVPAYTNTWASCRAEWPGEGILLSLKRLPSQEAEQVSRAERYGSGELQITSFSFCDPDGRKRHTFITGGAVCALIEYSAEKRVLKPVAVIAVYRLDGTCAMQLVSSRDGFSLGELMGKGTLSVQLDPLFLGPGDYVVSVAFFHDINLASSHEPKAYDLRDRCYALKVLSPQGMGVEIGIVNQPASWKFIA